MGDVNLALQAKLGSILIHVEEGLSATGSHFDWSTIEAMMNDTQVQTWLEDLRKLALLPVRRHDR